MRTGPEKIESFLRDEHAQERYEVEYFELRQVAGEVSQKVRTWSTDDDKDLEDLANEMYSAAAEDAEASSGGVSTYFVASYVKNDVGWKERSPKFRVNSGRMEANDEDILDMNESPSLKAQFGQILRHNEVAFKTSTGAAQGIIDRLATMNEMLVSRMDRMFEERFEMLEAFEGVLKVKSEQDREDRKELRHAKMVEEGFNTVKMLAPSVLAKLGVAQGAMPGEGANMIAVKEFLESMSPEQQAAFVGMLNPAQQAALATLVNQIEPEGNQKDERQGNGQQH